MPKRSNRGRVIRPRHIYVIVLRKGVLEDRRFKKKNLHYQGRRLCLYVGLSWLKPEERFQQHLDGVHPSRIVRRYGKRVLASRCKQITSLYETALKRERQHAQQLREEGYAVWQN